MSKYDEAKKKGAVFMQPHKDYWTWSYKGQRVMSEGFMMYWPTAEEAAEVFLNCIGNTDEKDKDI